MIRLALFLMAVLGFLVPSYSQDTLPDFSATTRDYKRVIIGWTNPFPVVKQISVQRSFDSLKNFKTIMTVPDPTPPQNGYVDQKSQSKYTYYRLFIVLDSGRYVFSKSRRAELDSANTTPVANTGMPVNGSKQVVVAETLTSKDVQEIKEKTDEKTAEPEKFFIVLKTDMPLSRISEKQYRRFRDSVVNKTKDTLLFSSVDTILIKPFVPKVVYKPSGYVFTERDGNIAISLPDALIKDYSIQFFDDDLLPIFRIKKVKEPYLTLDKATFLHAGWFRFELYENGKLKEKHRFFIPKDF